jgi:hypothetical protein
MEKQQQHHQKRLEYGKESSCIGRSVSSSEEVYPVSITLRNLFPIVSWQKQQHGFVRKLFSSQELSIYSNSPSTGMSKLLLHESTLEIYYIDPVKTEEVMILKCHHKASLHPRWDIHLDQLGKRRFYHLLRIRVVASVVLNVTKADNPEGVIIGRETLADEPLFAPHSYSTNPNDDFSYWKHEFSTKHQNVAFYCPTRRPLPQHDQQIKRISALPPNSLFVECSDGQTYVSYTLYDVLIKKEIITCETKSTIPSYNNGDNKGNPAEIFSESAFQALDAVSMKHSNTNSSSDVNHVKRENHHNDSTVNRKDNSETVSGQELLQLPNDNEDLIQFEEHSRIGSTQNLAQDRQRQQQTRNSELKRQIQSLERILELTLLEVEQLDNVLLKSSPEKVDGEAFSVEMQEQLEDMLNKEIFALQVAEITLEARQVMLLRQLREIYPIEKISNTLYTIRGLALSLKQQHQQQQMEDTFLVQSCALGYVTHLVTMCSKYLNIPLRYRLLCNSSRSAVVVASVDQPLHQPPSTATINNVLLLTDNTNSNSTMICDGVTISNNTNVYPLFQEKHYPPQSRDRFDKGIVFLERNIECLLDQRCIVYDPKSHMLAKLDHLFEQTICGRSALTYAAIK